MMECTKGESGGIQFSIIIPARNEERNIGRCLSSLKELDWPGSGYEVILVDNGSTDQTVAIAHDYGLHVLNRPADTVAGVRNFGAAQARGIFLVFLDADCTVPPDWFQAASRYIDRDDVSCFGSPPVVPEHSTWVQRVWFHIRKKTGVSETEWLESMNMFVRRSAFEQVGGFNAKLVTCEDYDLSIRLRSTGKLVSDDGIVAVHHGEATTIRHFFRKEHWRALGNLHGMKSHAFNWRELPSILLPILYCLFVFLLAVGIIAFVVFPHFPAALFVIMLILIWQLPLYFISLRKVGQSGGVVAASQLYLLLNVYFFARGVASLRWKS